MVETPMNNCVELQEKASRPSVPFRLRWRLVFVPWTAVTILIVAGLKQSLGLGFTLYAVTTPVGALVMQLFFQTRYESAGQWLAYGVGWLWYVALTFLVLRSSRQWVFYLLYAVLCASLLFSTGAYVVFRYFYKQ
jgi:hypothetical protein